MLRTRTGPNYRRGIDKTSTTSAVAEHELTTTSYATGESKLRTEIETGIPTMILLKEYTAEFGRLWQGSRRCQDHAWALLRLELRVGFTPIPGFKVPRLMRRLRLPGGR